MWLAALARTLLVTLSTAQPVDPNDLPKAPEPLRLTGIENATLTIPLTAGKQVEYRTVMTENGPRLRLTMGGATLDATRFQFRYDGRVFTIVPATDGRVAIVNSEPDPGAAKPAPKPKQP
jgi:hypothetical protein